MEGCVNQEKICCLIYYKLNNCMHSTVNGWSSTLPTEIAALSSKVFAAPVSTWWSFIVSDSLWPINFELTSSTFPHIAVQRRHLCFGLQNIYSCSRAWGSTLSAAIAVNQIENENGGQCWERRGNGWLFPQFRWCSFDSTREKKYVHKVQVSALLLYAFLIVWISFHLFIYLLEL